MGELVNQWWLTALTAAMTAVILGLNILLLVITFRG